jgi:CBS domain-containing protein
MHIADIMTRDPRSVQPGDTLQAAAQAMDELNVGVLPVCEAGRLVGMLTDRDIVVRSAAAGQDPCKTVVADAMTAMVRSVRDSASVLDAARIMQEHQVRRVPVLDADDRLAGILSLGDLADAGVPEAAPTLEAVSTPAAPDR